MSRLNCRTIQKDNTGLWRHNMCSLLLQNVTICKLCQTAKKTLATRLRRWKASQAQKRNAKDVATSPTQKTCWMKLQSKYRCAVRARNRAREKMKRVKSELFRCHKKMAHLTNFNFEKQLASGNITQNQVHVVKQIIEVAKHTNSKGRRYSEDWMLLCMLLHMRSSCGYEFLRSNEIVPLPCPRTIRRYAIVRNIQKHLLVIGTKI